VVYLCVLARTRAGDEVVVKPWIQHVINHVVATEDPPLSPTRACHAHAHVQLRTRTRAAAHVAMRSHARGGGSWGVHVRRARGELRRNRDASSYAASYRQAAVHLRVRHET
jgi:hypothetical protein